MEKGSRIAKIIARYSQYSRREAEEIIKDGRVKINGKIVENPAINITDESIKIDNKLLLQNQEAKVWVFHKPKGYITTQRDPDDRPTIFSILPKKMQKLISIGRLDINTEGLLLLTNDGEFARKMELPASKIKRTYRVRVHGKLQMERLSKLKKGITIEGIHYKSIDINLEKTIATNSWLKISLIEGKNREIKKVLKYFGLEVNRLIRISFGEYSLKDLPVGKIKTDSPTKL
jgi:23S rRNA pseudouridine2605 synthase